MSERDEEMELEDLLEYDEDEADFGAEIAEIRTDWSLWESKLGFVDFDLERVAAMTADFEEYCEAGFAKEARDTYMSFKTYVTKLMEAKEVAELSLELVEEDADDDDEPKVETVKAIEASPSPKRRTVVVAPKKLPDLSTITVGQPTSPQIDRFEDAVDPLFTYQPATMLDPKTGVAELTALAHPLITARSTMLHSAKLATTFLEPGDEILVSFKVKTTGRSTNRMIIDVRPRPEGFDVVYDPVSETTVVVAGRCRRPGDTVTVEFEGHESRQIEFRSH